MFNFFRGGGIGLSDSKISLPPSLASLYISPYTHYILPFFLPSSLIHELWRRGVRDRVCVCVCVWQLVHRRRDGSSLNCLRIKYRTIVRWHIRTRILPDTLFGCEKKPPFLWARDKRQRQFFSGREAAVTVSVTLLF